MTTHIGFIISPPLEPLIHDIIRELKFQCSYQIYPAYEPYQAHRLYTEHLDEVDFFIFSGNMFLYTVSTSEKILKKPCFAFEGTFTNVRDLLLSLIIENRQIDFSRIFIDASYSDYNYLGLKDLFPADQQPYFLNMEVPELEYAKKFAHIEEALESFMEYVHQKHLRLHETGAVDLSFTRFGTLVPHFERLQIPYRYIHPSREYIVSFIKQCLDDYHGKRHSHEDIGAIVVHFGTSQDNAEMITQCEKSFIASASPLEIDYSISRTDNRIEIIMPIDELSLLTNSLQDVSAIKKMIEPFDLAHSGIGIGKTIMEAKFHAHTAAEISKGGTKQIYYITKNGNINGPIGSHPITLSARPDSDLQKLSKQFGVDHKNLQKIIAFAKVSNTKTVTCDDISRYLQITRRSGSRILNRIVAGGGAVIYKDNRNGGKGRPKNCYELHFLDSLNED